MDYLIMVKLICLFIGVWFTFINLARAYGNNTIPAINFLYQTIGIVGFIVIQFKLYL